MSDETNWEHYQIKPREPREVPGPRDPEHDLRMPINLVTDEDLPAAIEHWKHLAAHPEHEAEYNELVRRLEALKEKQKESDWKTIAGKLIQQGANDVNELCDQIDKLVQQLAAAEQQRDELLAACQFLRRCLAGVFYTANDLERADAIIRKATTPATGKVEAK